MTKFLLTTISRLLNLFPQRLVLFMGDTLGTLWFWLVPIRRKTVLENLASTVGKGLPEKEIRRIARANYRHYGRNIMEIIQGFSWNRPDYLKRTKFHGMEHAEAYFKKGQGCFLLTMHLGNWEALIGAGVAFGLPADIVVKHARSKFFEDLIQWYRSRTGVGIFLESGTARDILRSLSNGRTVAFLLDQFMGPPIGLPVKFFGREAGTAAALALMTDKREYPVLPTYSYRDENGVLNFAIEPAIEYGPLSEDKNERLHQKTQIYNDVYERLIRKHPEQWLWLHRRWKPFRGESRWALKSAALSTALATLLLMFGCTSAPPPTPTGIELPPDPKIVVPSFQKDAPSFEESNLTPPPATPAPEVTPEPPAPKGKKKKMVKNEKAPPPKENVVPTPPPAFQVLPAYSIPFEIGETLEISLGWMGLPAGTATLEVREGQPFQGRKTYHLYGNVLSSKLVDTIYHVDNTAESFVDSSGFIPYKFLLHMLETHQKKETRVAFDHTEKKAYYWSKRISQKWGDETQDRTDELVPGAKDLWSALYYARTLTYKMHEKQTLYVYENGKNYFVEVEPVAKEVLNTKLGAFQCWKIQVTIKLDNILRPTGDIFLWLSDDNKKYIVKFDAKIKIGSLYGNLVSLREKK